MPERVRAIAPTGVDFALDVAGNGVLPDLVELAGARERTITVADFLGAQRAGVRFSRGDDGRATYALAQAAQMAEAGRFAIAVGRTFSLANIAEAHRSGRPERCAASWCWSWTDRAFPHSFAADRESRGVTARRR